jgi:SAM-dependent methyltransferase
MNSKELHDRRFGWEYETQKISMAEIEKLEKILNAVKKSKARIKRGIDIGCKPEMTGIMRKKLNAQIIGTNITKRGMKGKDFVCLDANKPLPYKPGNFDFVYCGEIIEHVYDSDLLMAEIKRVLRKGGILVITTPNLASFWNRFFLLFGYQPHLYAMSGKKVYGNPFLKFDLFIGHIKVFTYKALVEFVEDNGFKILNRWGEYIHNPTDNKIRSLLRFVFSKFISLSEDVVLICKKK